MRKRLAVSGCASRRPASRLPNRRPPPQPLRHAIRSVTQLADRCALRTAARRRRVRVHPARDRRERRHRARPEQAPARAGAPRAAPARAAACDSYEAYCDHVRESGPEELVGLINALTTNVTSFFRENHHFEALAELHAARGDASATQRRVACASGRRAARPAKKPYCLAMVAARSAAGRLALGSARFSRPTSTATWSRPRSAASIRSTAVASLSPERLRQLLPEGQRRARGQRDRASRARALQ